MKKLVFALVAGAALVLTGCAAGPTVIPAESLSTAQTPGASAPASETPTATEDAATPSESASASDQAKFGDTAKFDSGVTITISKGVAFKPSTYAMSLGGKITGKPMLYTVTVKNGGTEPLTGMSVTTTATSGTAEAPQIIDTEKKINGIATSTILPGKTLVYKVAFDTANPKDVTIDVSPDYISHVYFSN